MVPALNKISLNVFVNELCIRMNAKYVAIPIFYDETNPFYFKTEFEPEKTCVSFCFFKSDALTVFCKHLQNYLFSGVPHQFIVYLLYTRNWSYFRTSEWYYKKIINEHTTFVQCITNKPLAKYFLCIHTLKYLLFIQYLDIIKTKILLCFDLLPTIIYQLITN